jgi:hypothetical protein
MEYDYNYIIKDFHLGVRVSSFQIAFKFGRPDI